MEPELVTNLTSDSSLCVLWISSNLISSSSKKLVITKNLKNIFRDFSKTYNSIKKNLVVSKYYQEQQIIPSDKPYFLEYLEERNHSLISKTNFRDVEHLSEIISNNKDEFNNVYEQAVSEFNPMKKLSLQQANIYHHFCPLMIQHEIEQKLGSHYIYTSSISKHHIQLNTHTCQFSLSERFVGELLSRIHTLNILTREVRPNININLWCCRLKKKLPNEKCLGSHSVNSASTYIAHCQDVKVWRIEESRKVVTHELFHCLGLDFHHVPDFFYQKILSVFNIPNQDLLFCETYVEMWAVIINCFTIAELFSDSVNHLDNLFNYERYYAAFQTAKILHFFNFKTFGHFFNLHGFSTYEKDNSSFKQSSSILSYYILKSALLFKINDFIDFCYQYNRDCVFKFQEKDETYQAFLKLLLKSLDDPDFKKVINTSLKLLSTMSKDNFMYTNLRMTCLETYL